MKFVGPTAKAAERTATEFIRSYCVARGYRMRDELAVVQADVAGVRSGGRLSETDCVPAQRKIRFLPIRFGVARPVDVAGTGNLSETGIFIITDSPADSGNWLNLRLDTDQQLIPLRGQVRWMRRQHRAGQSPGMGVQLHSPPARYLDYVRNLYS